MNKKRFEMEPKKRFSARADNYSKFRPNYPEDIISYLESEKILYNNSIIADIGSGTGILSELFLKNGNLVFGIEPNMNMRNAAEYNLKKYENFHSIDGSAECTNMEENSICIITVGQAFHWFDQVKARKEFKRILKPEGNVVIIWNNRKRSGSRFLEQYEDLLLTYGTDYRKIRDIQIDFENFYRIGKNSEGYVREIFENYQLLDYPGLKGRLLSTSYAPLDDHPNYINMITELEKIFKENNQNGLIRFDYETEVYCGRLYD
jgi:ubiquinone/menaquinone biosynthesis C-methylase UbiE